MLPSNPLRSYAMMGSLLVSRIALATDSHVRRGAMETSFLDSDSLAQQELSIVSSLRDSSKHRSLQANNCMDDLFSGNAGCTANDVEFINVTGIVVYDPGAYQDPNTGIWKDACRGNDDYVNLAFTADINVGASRYDIGMYINTEGGSACEFLA